ncbi:Fungal Zn2-Cys6 binuclear cluster domain-containing protein [Cladophialophora immunda]|nr:Fungal Zn2-Cys6 binuclear cluster domain-containing protein [Cladophialophora immunda]
MAPQVDKRQPRVPLSCENCRKRKIKCSGERPFCDTCARRGFSHTCFYLRQNVQAPAGSSSDEVLQRVRRVETLLERQVYLLEQRLEPSPKSQSSNPDNLSQHQPSSANSSPWTEVEQNPPETAPSTIVGTVVVSQEGHERFIPGLASSDADAVNELIQSISAPPMSTSFPFSTEATATRRALLDALPPGRQCDELKRLFFDVFSPLFHILHDPTFHAEYADFRQKRGEVSLSFLALLFVILSISVTALDSDHPLLTDLGVETTASANIKSLATKYRTAAMGCLSADQFLWRHNLHTVQALVLLIYALSHAHGPAWALLGTTFNICISIGCHIDPSQLNLDPVRGEQRRRCWAGLMLLYTIQSTCLGNLAPMTVTATVRLPADVDDERISMHETPAFHADDSRPRPLSKMSYILFKFKLYRLASDIANFAREHGSLNGLIELDGQISQEEHDHDVRFTDLQRLPVYHLAHLYIIKNYTSHLRLILHRRYLPPHSAAPDSTLYEFPEQVLQSRQYCKMSAMKILSNHEDLCCEERLKPYRWFVYGLGGYQTFLAASTLVVLLGSEDESVASDRADVIYALLKCQARFEQLSARSDISAKAARILRRTLGSPVSSNGGGVGGTAPPPPQEPPGLYRQSSSTSDESKMCSTSQRHQMAATSPGSHGQPPSMPPGRRYGQAGFAGALPNANEVAEPPPPQHPQHPQPPPHSFFPCPQPLYELMSLPAEQWLGGPSALAWDWNGWVDVPEPQITRPDMFMDASGVMM